MIQLKDKVTHIRFGKGIVENLTNNDSIAHVDYKGLMQRTRADELIPGWVDIKGKRPADLLKDVSVKIHALQKEYIDEVERIDNLEKPSDSTLIRRQDCKEFADKLEVILQNK